MEKVTQMTIAPKLSGSPSKKSKPASLLLNTLYPAEYYVYSAALVVRAEMQCNYVILSVIQNNEILSRIIIDAGCENPTLNYKHRRFVITSTVKTVIVDYSCATITETINEQPSDEKIYTYSEPVHEEEKHEHVRFEMPSLDLDLSELDLSGLE